MPPKIDIPDSAVRLTVLPETVALTTAIPAGTTSVTTTLVAAEGPSFFATMV